MATLTLTTAAGTATQTLSTGARGPAGSGGGGTTYTAGTGLTLTTGAFAIGSSVVTLTGTQTLTNKTLGDVLTTGMQTFALGSMAYFDAGSEILFDGGLAYIPNGAINFRGTGSTNYNLTLYAVDPTINRIITFPDADGAVALTTDITSARVAASITTSAHKQAFFLALGVPFYDNLTAANAALAIGQPYYDIALAKLQITTV